MNAVEIITDTYRNAGEEDRLDWYLGYPGLRDLFDAIEREARPPVSLEDNFSA